jgi:cation:H+ antiporter
VGETFDPHRTSSPCRIEVAQTLYDPGPRGAGRFIVIHVALLLGCAVVLYLACEWFVNAVEWVGVQLNVGPIAVGTILAAAGTALPESVVTLVAVSGHGPNGADIGVGAALGGPLVVGTIAYATVGATLIARRWSVLRAARTTTSVAPGDPRQPDSDVRVPALPTGPNGILPLAASQRLARDQRWFLAVFAMQVAVGLLAFSFKPWLGVVFFAVYAVYFWRELSGGGAGYSGDLEPCNPAATCPPGSPSWCRPR